MPELLVVIGIIGLLIAILLPPLRAAHRQALDTRCKVQEQQLGVALEAARFEHDFYPLWDDGGSPTRYTWIDVLVQNGLLGNARVGYCPDDLQPSPINSARGQQFQVRYPGSANQYGVDYSYGISVPLSAAGWIWRPDFSPSEDNKPRRFENHERNPAQRLLVADANWTTIYNASGTYLTGGDWSYPSWYDNTIDWRHHGRAANILFQDSHVSRVQYQIGRGIDTAQLFVWYPGEPLTVGPSDQHGTNFYPHTPPVNVKTGEAAGSYPPEMAPGYYTNRMLWTQIFNK